MYFTQLRSKAYVEIYALEYDSTCYGVLYIIIERMLQNYSIVTTQSRIIGAVRGAHSQLWGTIIPVCSLYAARKYDRRFGTPAIV